jgi:uncharacterized protein with HEPN domain
MRSDRQRLADTLAQIEHVNRHLDGASAAAVTADRRLLHAVLYNLAIIGEALGTLSPDVRGLAPAIPWGPIRGMRNRIVHSYWRVDPSIVVEVVARDLPVLRAEVERLAASLDRADP